MLRPGRGRGAIPRLRHEQVAESYVDYHFGRLSPEMNTAIERHIKSCARCKREGLTNAASQRKQAGRRLRGVRGGKPLVGRRGRMWIMLVLLVALTQVVIYQIANGHTASLSSLLTRPNSADVSLPASKPVTLTASNSLPLNTSGATAIAVALGDKRLAVAGGNGEHNVVIWDIAGEKAVKALTWPGSDSPTSLSWSADGSRLAAADGAQIVIWGMPGGSTLWQFTVPAAPAMRVYDVDQQVIIGHPNPASAFTSGALAWGADGALTAAPAGALGDVGATTPDAPVVALWSSAGTHIFAGDGGTALVGSSPSDVGQGVTLLSWSPDGRFLLWGALTQPIAVGAQPTAKDSLPPDGVIAQLAARVAAAGAHAGAVAWFSPVGKLVAVCDQTASSAHIEFVTVSTGQVKFTLPDDCSGALAHSASWSSTGKNFFVVPSKGPLEIYTLLS